MLVATTPKTAIRKASRPQLPLTTLGITFPFQPSMHDKKFILATLNYIHRAVETKLKEKYNSVFGKTILARLDKTFGRLNYNTHRKTVAIVIGPDDETITYLNVFTKPLIYFNKNISLLDLLHHVNNQPEFFLLYSADKKSMLFEYYNGKLHKEYETTGSAFISNSPGQQLLVRKPTKMDQRQRTLNVLKLLNFKTKKPVFVTGSTAQGNIICNMSAFREIMFRKANTLFPGDAEDKLRLLASEIDSEWKYWHYEFLAGKIELAEKANRLISNITAVLKALESSKDGILLIDKYYNKQLKKSLKMNTLFKSPGIWIRHLERFLSRGNQIEIVNPGLLKDHGGIALIEEELMNPLNRRLVTGNINPRKNNAVLF